MFDFARVNWDKVQDKTIETLNYDFLSHLLQCLLLDYF